MRPGVLSIGALDPIGATGLVADWNVLRKFRVNPRVVAASVTLEGQDPESVEPALLRRQLKAYLDPKQVKAAKTGLLLNRDNIEVTVNMLEEPAHRVERVVVDLAIESPDAMMLLSNAALSLVKMRLISIADVAVAYLSEAERISGAPVNDITGMKEAAEALHMFGAKEVLIRADKVVDDEWLDIYFDGKEHQFLFRKQGVPTAFRKRRDVFCSCLVAELAQGTDTKRAAEIAQEFELTDAVTRLVAAGPAASHKHT